MLTDQTFARRTTIALGTDFFTDSEGDLSYAFVLSFRNDERIHAVFDFHFWDIDDEGTSGKLAVLDAWGCGVSVGKLFPEKPDAKLVRELERMTLAVEAIHARKLSALYRLSGRKNISLTEPEVLFDALRLAAIDAEPDALFKHLRALGT